MKVLGVSLDPPITCHIHMDGCWVCGRKFSAPDEVVEDAVVKHVHHVVPRAAGGESGPTVTLCTHHHDLLHRIAEAWTSERYATWMLPSSRGYAFIQQQPTRFHTRLIYLARVVAVSLIETLNDPNKRGQMSIQLSAEEGRMLTRLQKVYGGSKPQVLLRLLHIAYKNQFPLD